MNVRLFVSLMMGLLASCSEALAQEVNDGSEASAQNAAKKGKEKDAAQDSIALQEVVVKAARVVNKVDGKLIFPSEVQKQNSHSGFSLLSKLMLPNIRVDELAHSIVATNLKGNVQVRINGIIANVHEVQALDVSAVTSVDYIDSPGVRYGKDVAYVIDIHTRRSTMGGSLGFDLQNALTTVKGTNDIYASLNRGKSQFHLFYEQSYADYRASDSRENAQYRLNDGMDYCISRNSVSGKNKNFGNVLEMKYSLADSASYVFQTIFSTSFNNSPRTFAEQLVTESTGSEYVVHSNDKSRDFTPSLDLYFYHQLGKHQSLTADVLGTYIQTKSDSYDDEGTPYAYQVDGKTYSLIGEAIYENQLKPFTFSAGLNVNWKYMNNVYRGDAESKNGIHSSGIYGFAQLKGNLSKLSYVAGFGLSNQRYHQGDNQYSFWLSRPKLTLSYPLSKAWQLRYDFELSQHISQVAMVSDTRIRKNKMEWTVGNPSLKPNARYEQTLTLSYSQPRFRNDLSVDYRINRNANLAKYTRTDDDQFLYTQANQPHCNMLYLMEEARYDIIPDHLIFAMNASINRFFNKGDDYLHCYTGYSYGGSMQGYLGKWAMMLYADNGWNFMEGENIGHQGINLQGSVGYRLGNFNLTLYVVNPFIAHPKMQSAELVNALIRKQVSYHNSSMGNMVMLSVAWRINRGREYRSIQQSIKNKERETGILR